MNQLNPVNNDETTIEVACVIKTICDLYQIKQNELYLLPPENNTVALTENVKFIKRIPVNIPIAEEITPHNGQPYLILYKQRSIAQFEGLSARNMNKLELGLGEFELQGLNRPIQFWAWNGAKSCYITGGSSLFFIRQKDFYHFAKTLKRYSNNHYKKVNPPVLPSGMLMEIYNNSVGFLLKGKKNKTQYHKYNIPYKRGILLCGRPGCGKTLTCKWLRELCIKDNLAYRIITMENYREAIHRHTVRSLFKLPDQRMGIIFFDDMDIMVKNRKESFNTHELSTFLSELDGLEPTEGIVYIFTTNYISELDEAFVRPGRIDLWIPFFPPNDQLRKQFIIQRFDSEIQKAIDILELINRTKEYSFAEMEEIRKLFCMDIINGKPLDIERTFSIFNKHRKEFQNRAQIKGFSSLEDDEEYFPTFFENDESILPCLNV